MDALGLWKSIAQPEDLCRGVGLLLDSVAGGLKLLPHGDHHERQEHGVDHAQSRVDEARYVVRPLARAGGHQTVHQFEPYEREQTNPPDHKYTIDYGSSKVGISSREPHWPSF